MPPIGARYGYHHRPQHPNIEVPTELPLYQHLMAALTNATHALNFCSRVEWEAFAPAPEKKYFYCTVDVHDRLLYLQADLAETTVHLTAPLYPGVSPLHVKAISNLLSQGDQALRHHFEADGSLMATHSHPLTAFLKSAPILLTCFCNTVRQQEGLIDDLMHEIESHQQVLLPPMHVALAA